MDTIHHILKELEKVGFKVSTDTRKDLTGSVYFALRGENFDGNNFVQDALQKGAVAVVTDNPKNTGEHTYLVENVLDTLNLAAHTYRQLFTIPIIAIGGSNGKTTSKDLVREVLRTKYKVHATEGSLNNHFGVPLSILSMKRDTEIAIFEIGANHPKEHLHLLDILSPTHVIVTNNGMDHLEGFGSPEGARRANKELYDWAQAHNSEAFVHKKQSDLMEDSQQIKKRILYPQEEIEVVGSTPLTLSYNKNMYKTHLIGAYNTENIQLALAISNHFDIDTDTALEAIKNYIPLSKRSEFLTKNKIDFVVDCYNANPTSMILALESFSELKSIKKGVILGDMLELGSYSENEHRKIVDFVSKQNFSPIIFVGQQFKKIIENNPLPHQWFADSDDARKWFASQDFNGFTFLLKGSRGMKIEKVLDM